MSSEKDDSSFTFGTPDVAEVEAFEVDWTIQEEARAKRKLDLIIMPLLMLGFFCLQLDRGNISNAITDSFFKDVGIVQNQFNIGQQLLSLGIVLFELPSNLLLYRVGPGRWLSSQVVAFGLVSTFQAFQSNYGGFLATRLLLGLTESGYIPGALYTLSTWYTRKETAKRVMVFFIGNLSASATSNLLSYGILQMRGVAGKPGWFWLFVVMGLFTIVSGFVLACFLPDSFQRPTSFLLPKLTLFSERELHILRYRVWKDDPIKSQKKKHISIKALKSALSYWPLYAHAFITITNNGPLSALGSYTPTIISSFGFEKLRSNALASVGLWIQIPVAVGLSYISDHFNLRAVTTIFALSLNLLFQTLLRAYTDSDNRDQKFGIMVLVQIMMFVPHPLNVAWMSLRARNSEERAVAMAMIIMAANMAGIYAAQLFRSDDKPRYHRALTVDVAILAASLLATILLALYYRYKDKKDAQSEEARGIASPPLSDSDDGKDIPPLVRTA